MESVKMWLALKSVSGVGNHLFKSLIEKYQLPENVVKASLKELMRVNGVSAQVAENIKQSTIPTWVDDEIERAQEYGHELITLADEKYPELLKQIPDPPPVLYSNGNFLNTSKSIAVVGTRHATPYGIATTKKLTRGLVENGFKVVSGLARGIDTAAHQGCLEAGGQTMAVLGNGLDIIYPKENNGLFKEITKKGTVITEFAYNAPPLARHFPIRNRIISGLCVGTLVVEAAVKSGSLITARLALEQNRDVFAVPGSIQSKKSAGTHYLLKQGAKLVETVQDIVQEVIPMLRDEMETGLTKLKNANQPTLSEKEKEVIQAIGSFQLDIEELIQKTKMTSAELSSLLMQMELKGIIQKFPGMVYASKWMES